MGSPALFWRHIGLHPSQKRAWVGHLLCLTGPPRQPALLSVQEFAHDDHRSFSFLFRQRQTLNNRSKFIEYLLHPFQLTGLECILHGFISNEGEFRPAVSNILK